jgi:hypothetical protein
MKIKTNVKAGNVLWGTEFAAQARLTATSFACSGIPQSKTV